jgi:hypothetical protein
VMDDSYRAVLLGVSYTVAAVPQSMSIVTETDTTPEGQRITETETLETTQGQERITASKIGVLVVDGKVERLTGAGKFVVAPIREDHAVDVGDQVMIVVVDKLQPAVYLQVMKERVTTPFRSNWAIIVRGNRYVEKCNVWYDNNPLSALDVSGVARTELPLPRDGMLYFRIPEAADVENESMVEVKDGVVSILLEKFGSLTASPIREGYPTVTVSGKFAPLSKTDTYPASVEFTNTVTGQVFLAVAVNGEYSAQLPNRESYRVNVSWNMIPENRTGNAQAGTLALNSDDHSFAYNVNW